VAKILVADDNSNIQKMVVLALKDQGIEVTAVGNGEAAVRKIADLKPDLVLADIFMPVRNGYEVCKFVKDDSALSHIPVILLVGAFDPLDEQEAQRVGADGVLKKPFVPPDPLISMVKSALARAGVSLGPPATPPPPMPVAAKLESVPLPKVVPPPPVPVFAVSPEEEFVSPAVPSRANPFTIDKGVQPLAFGSLLESPVVDDDAIFAVSSRTHAAPERDWGNSSAPAEEEEADEDSKVGSWRVGSMQETADEAPAGQTDWREAAFSGIVSEKAHSAEWAPSIEKNNLSITEEEAAALARSRADFSAIADSRGPEDWSKAIEAVLPENPPAPREIDAPYVAELPEISPTPAVPEATAITQPAISHLTPAPDANSWMAGAVSPWEAEIQGASQLASTWESAKSTPAIAVEDSSATEAFLDSGLMSGSPEPQAEEPTANFSTPAVPEEPWPAEPATETVSAIESLLSPVTQEILHEEAAQAVAEQQPMPPEATASAEATVGGSVPVVAPDIDEIVAKVLARMNPDVLQAVTREILKPLVEAMIKDELHKK
jgi:CheY-like chemotaxis protein